MKVWVYSRSSDPHPRTLFEKTKELLREAQNRGYSVVGVSQDMGSGRSLGRVGLQKALQAVRDGSARAMLVQDSDRLSIQVPVLKKVLEHLQDYDAVLITTGSDLRYELYRKGLETYFYRRAAQTGCGRGNEANMEAAKEKVIREIQYFVSCRTLTRLLEQGKITEKIRRRTVVALAEKYGVLRLPV